ncbi:MAG: hypothetical protein WEE50_04150 [Chloroflexota bacterium]
MTLSAAPRTQLPPGRLFGGVLLGSGLVTAGLAADYVALSTPLVWTLIPGTSANGGSIGIGFGVWAFALIAGGALAVAGTSRLARLVAMVRGRSDRGGPAARALASASDGVTVAGGVVPGDGPAIPELVIGAFGAAVVHPMPPSRLIRHGARWETRTSEGWRPMDDPLEAAARDADRVRRWLSLADLDFVVRVYAAVIVDDRTIQRSPVCATITAEQIPGWIAALPRQRTLTKGRRDRLLAMALSRTEIEAGKGNRNW